MVQAEVCPMMTKKVPDLATGGERNRKHAAFCSVAIINELTGHMDPIILQGEMPKFLIDGDSLEDVKSRLFAELEEVFKNAQDVLDGKVTMEELHKRAVGDLEEVLESQVAEEEEGSKSTLKLVE